MRTLASRSVALAAALLLPSLAPLGAQDAGDARPDRRPTLFAVEFRNGAIGRAADYDPLAKGLPDMLLSELSANPAVRVVDRDHLKEILREQDLSTSGRIDDATAVRVGRLLGAHHYIKGSFVIDARGRLRLDAHAVSTETSRVEHVESVSGRADDVLDLIAEMSRKLNAGLRLPDLPPVEARPAAPATPPPSGSAANTAPAPGAGQPAPPAAPAAAPASGQPTTRVASAARTPAAVPARTTARAPKKEDNFRAVMLYSRALAEEDRGNVQGAVELYRKSLEVFPEYTTARQRLQRLEKKG